jgi:hypothetical protein
MGIDIEKILIQRLEKKGIQPSQIPCFIRDIGNTFFDDPCISHHQANSHLHFIGWNDIYLDYNTFQLALECINDVRGKGPQI